MSAAAEPRGMPTTASCGKRAGAAPSSPALMRRAAPVGAVAPLSPALQAPSESRAVEASRPTPRRGRLLSL